VINLVKDWTGVVLAVGIICMLKAIKPKKYPAGCDEDIRFTS
jgi:hypothetical protein